MNLNWVAVSWGVLSLVLIVAEILVPGAFLLWLGLAAGVLFLVTLLMPALPILAQIVLFAVFSVVFIQIYRTKYRGRTRNSDNPLLNRRADQLIGNSYVLETAVVQGRGTVRVGDAIWTVRADQDLPAGSTVRVVAVTDGMNLAVEPVA